MAWVKSSGERPGLALPKGHFGLDGPSVNQGVESPSQRAPVNDLLPSIALPALSPHLGRGSREEEELGHGDVGQLLSLP